jgi:hypothetical protein
MGSIIFAPYRERYAALIKTTTTRYSADGGETNRGLDLGQCGLTAIGSVCNSAQRIPAGRNNMTQHMQPEQTREDQRTMRRLAIVVACFIAFTAAMAVAVGVALG